jgi:hypothetical protein
LSNKLIADVGAALWGERWQTELSRALGISDRTVRNWVAGTSEPKQGVYMDLLRISEERAADLDEVITRVREAMNSASQ